jgi:uncharacterized protein DUF6916
VEPSRRKFVKAGIMATLFAALPLKTAAPAWARPRVRRPKPTLPDPLNYYTKSTFVPYVNTDFRIYPGSSNPRDVTLVEVRDLSAQYGMASPDECFSLLFLGAAGTALPQKTYQVEHAALGKFALFIVPISRHNSQDPEYYEAVFNRRHQYCTGCQVVTLDAPPVSPSARPTSLRPNPLGDLRNRLEVGLRKFGKSID